jgi:hypothetical protein
MTPIGKIRKRLDKNKDILPRGYIRDVTILLAEIDRLKAEVFVYENTPFAHWHERALSAEEKLSCMKHQFDELTFFVGEEAGV